MLQNWNKRVQSQFGASAEAYATSSIHARGESLSVLQERINPNKDWRILDIGTGTGHTALAFSSQAKWVVGLDLTHPMLVKTVDLARQQAKTNLFACQADSLILPFENASFDLATCRLAFHHFPDPQRVLSELVRILKFDGIFGFTDNIVVPDSECATYYNEFEKLRDPSHYWVHNLGELTSMMETVGLTIQSTQQLSKEFEFHTWADRQHVSPGDKKLLLKMIRRVPPGLQPLLSPRWDSQTVYFSLWEVVLIAKKVRGIGSCP